MSEPGREDRTQAPIKLDRYYSETELRVIWEDVRPMGGKFWSELSPSERFDFSVQVSKFAMAFERQYNVKLGPFRRAGSHGF